MHKRAADVPCEPQPLKEVFEVLHADRARGTALFFQGYYRKVYGIAYSFLHSRSAAEDTAQNVIYKILTMDGARFPRENPESWLYSVVKNEALEVLRAERRIVPLDKIAEIGSEDEKIQAHVDMDAFESMLNGLDAERKKVVTLKVLCGYTHREIARLLGKPVGTVQWLYNTAIRKIRLSLSTLVACVVSAIGALLGSVATALRGQEDVGAVAQAYSGTNWAVFIGVGAVIAVLSAIFLIIFKNSDQIPTKAESRNV